MTQKKSKKFSKLLFIGLGKEKAFFIENLSMLVASGMNLVIALESIRDEIKYKPLKRAIDEMKEQISSGNPIWKSMDESGLFAKHIIAMIRTGEESGTLKENLKMVALRQKKEQVFHSRIKSAMTYPVIVLALGITIALGISWFVLPQIVPVFKALNEDLPFLTRILVYIGELFFNHGYVIVPLIIVTLLLLLFFLFFFPKTKHVGQWLLFHTPVAKKLIMEVEVSRLGYILGSLLNAGLPIVDALDSLARASTFNNYTRLYQWLRDEVNDGQTFRSSLREYKNSRKMIPLPIQEMIGAGEQSGNLADSLISIGESYELKTELTAKNLTTALEPIILIIIGIGVLGIALAIIVPIYGLLTVFS